MSIYNIKMNLCHGLQSKGESSVIWMFPFLRVLGNVPKLTCLEPTSIKPDRWHSEEKGHSSFSSVICPQEGRPRVRSFVCAVQSQRACAGVGVGVTGVLLWRWSHPSIHRYS
jgi:hypothetical protein